MGGRTAGALLMAVALLPACASGGDDSSTGAWATEVNEICHQLADRVNRLGEADNFIVLSTQARELAVTGRLAFAEIASVPRPEGRSEEIRQMVRQFTDAFDKYERYADALLDRDEARVAELEREIGELLSRAQEAASDLGADCLAA